MQSELFDERLLADRLAALGLRGVRRIELHRNRTVMVSITAQSVLRLHAGYAYAPDAVLQDIVGFLRPNVSRRRRHALERRIVEFPVHRLVSSPAPTRRRRSVRPEDRRLVRRLAQVHADLNRQHFSGILPVIPFRVSRRMRRCLGELTLNHDGTPIEIAIGYHHMMRDGWVEVEHTVLHEMIHQWQAVTGRTVDHGALFRRKARDVGIEGRAARTLIPVDILCETKGPVHA